MPFFSFSFFSFVNESSEKLRDAFTSVKFTKGLRNGSSWGEDTF